MQRRTFVLRLKEGMEREYINRHKEIWPEMLKMLKDAGIKNYSIWLWRDRLFGYYESDDLSFTDLFKSKSPVQARWSEYMSDIISFTEEDGSEVAKPECVFLME